MTLRGLAVAAAAVCLFLSALSALAQDHFHPPQDAELHYRFYSTWMQPDNPRISCCNLKDCYPTEARFRNGHWEAKQRETGQWLTIPPQKIEWNRDSPDGRSHMCASASGDIYCFIAGSGT